VSRFFGVPRTSDESLPSAQRNVQEFLSDNKMKHQEIINRGPLVPSFQPRQLDEDDLRLPRSPFRLHDIGDNHTDFLFQSNSIFSRPHNGTADLTFYPEIRDIACTDIPGFGGTFVQMTLDTKFGMRTFFFRKIYCDLVRRIIEGKRSGKCD
jgi:hypothetical protein